MQKAGARVLALGVMFYTGTMFPSTYMNALFIAQRERSVATTPAIV